MYLCTNGGIDNDYYHIHTLFAFPCSLHPTGKRCFLLLTSPPSSLTTSPSLSSSFFSNQHLLTHTHTHCVCLLHFPLLKEKRKVCVSEDGRWGAVQPSHSGRGFQGLQRTQVCHDQGPHHWSLSSPSSLSLSLSLVLPILYTSHFQGFPPNYLFLYIL